MKQKLRDKINDDLARLECKAFLPRDIESLFFNLRSVAGAGLVREVGDFIAHPEGRRQGIAHRWVQLKTLQIRMAISGMRGLPQAPIEVASFSKQFYEQVLLYSIDQTKRWPTSAGVTRDQARAFLRSIYTPFGSAYYLRAVSREEVARLEHVLGHLFQVADFHDNPVLSDQKVFDGVSDLFGRIDRRLGTDWQERFAGIRSSQADELAVCLLAVLHESEFQLCNGETLATRVHGLPDGLALQTEFDVHGTTVSIPVFATSADPAVYFPAAIEAVRGILGGVRCTRDAQGAVRLGTVP